MPIGDIKTLAIIVSDNTSSVIFVLAEGRTGGMSVTCNTNCKTAIVKLQWQETLKRNIMCRSMEFWNLFWSFNV